MSDDYIDTRTDAEIDEVYRRANEVEEPPEPDPWWNRPSAGWLIVLGLLGVIGLCIFGMVHWT